MTKAMAYISIIFLFFVLPLSYLPHSMDAVDDACVWIGLFMGFVALYVVRHDGKLPEGLPDIF